MKKIIGLFLITLFIVLADSSGLVANAAISFVKQASSTLDGVTSSGVSVAISVNTAGDNIVGGCSIYGTGNSISGVSDATGTVYTTATSSSAPTTSVGMTTFYATNVTAGSHNVTCLGPSTNGWLIWLEEWSGLATSNLLDTSSTNATSGANTTISDPLSITTTNANDLVIGFASTQTSACNYTSVRPGYAVRGDSVPSACSRINGVWYDQTFTNTTTTDATATWNGVTAWAAAAIALKQATAATPASTTLTQRIIETDD